MEVYLSENRYGRKFRGHRDRCVTASTSLKTVILGPVKGIRDGDGRLHPQLVATGDVLPYHPLGYHHK